MKPKKLRLTLAKELVILVLCLAAAVYLRGLFKFTSTLDQIFWVLKAGVGLYLAYHVIGFFIKAVTTILGIAIFLILALAAGYWISGSAQTEQTASSVAAKL